MIELKRLDELIKHKATIYCKQNGEISEIALSEASIEMDADKKYYMVYKDYVKHCGGIFYPEHLYETKDLFKLLKKKEEQCFVLYCTLYEKLEEEGEYENVASMIEYLTGGFNFADECESFKRITNKIRGMKCHNPSQKTEQT